MAESTATPPASTSPRTRPHGREPAECGATGEKCEAAQEIAMKTAGRPRPQRLRLLRRLGELLRDPRARGKARV